jgi:alkylhydroperoxidase family enzyme
MVRLSYWFTQRIYGRAFTPQKVIYARKPELLSFAMKIAKFEGKQNSLDPTMRLLIKLSAATANGCRFCQDLVLANAIRSKLGTDKFKALLDGTPGVFSEPEQAVIDALGEYNRERRMSDHAFDGLKRHFTDVQIVEILALNGFEHFFNALTVPLEIGSDGLERIAEESLRRP